MCPPATVQSDDISFSCTDEELCIHIERIMNGSPVPVNVITDVNPYQYMPSNLPGKLLCQTIIKHAFERKL